MRLALGFNPVASVPEMTRLATQADGAGYDSIWLHESLYQRDIVTYLASMIGSTKRIRLGSGIINTFTRHPVAAAATFATLSEVSGGRVIFGLGLGSFPTMPLIGQQIFPVDKTRPLRRIREYLEVVGRIWSGKKVDFDGEFFKVHNLSLGFPISGIPVFIASLSPMTQAFAGVAADGAILSPALDTATGTRRMVENVEKGEAKSGRRIEKASYMITSMDPDPETAKRAVKDYYFFAYQLAEVVKPELLQPYGITEERLKPMKEAWKKGDIEGAKHLIPDEAIEALAIVGDRDHALRRIEEYLEAGVSLPIIMPIGNVDFAVKELAPGA